MSKIFADDTPIPVLDPGRGRTKVGRLWVYTRDDRPWAGPDPPAAVYFYSSDRKAERPAASHLEGYRGILQVDGYAGFERLTAAMKPWLEMELGRIPGRGGLAAAIRYALIPGGQPFAVSWTTVASNSTTTRSNARSGPLPSAARTTCSPAQIVGAPTGRPSARSSPLPSSTASSRSLMSKMCWSA